MKTSDVLIHIGYAKAGSTWLQDHFIDPESGFLGPDKTHDYFPITDFVMTSPFLFDAVLFRESFKGHHEKSTSLGCVPVLSSERLSGHWFTGGFDSKEMSLRLHATFPDARILIIFREQISMLGSVYRQYVKKGGCRPLKQFLFPPPEGRGREPEFAFEFFNYDLIIRHYQDLFGNENVMALPLEFIAGKPEEAFEVIQGFAGATGSDSFQVEKTRSNTGISAAEAAIKRRLNVFLRADTINDYSILHNTITKYIAASLYHGLRFFITDQARKKSNKALERKIRLYAANRYCASNRATGELLQLDLAQYGYKMQAD